MEIWLTEINILNLCLKNLTNSNVEMKIRSKEELEEAISRFGILPFFRNNIKGLSIEEMAPPSLLFGGNEFDGCWEWKGPVIRKRTSAYGKFFKRKAGFISETLLPHFLNLRRSQYSIKEGSKEEMIYDIIGINDKITSTELREGILGLQNRKRTMYDLPDLEDPSGVKSTDETKKPGRHVLESPLQYLQMGGYICISDFRYKTTRRGERYGWGVAEYSLPENIFQREHLIVDLPPDESLEFMVQYVSERYSRSKEMDIIKLLSK